MRIYFTTDIQNSEPEWYSHLTSQMQAKEGNKMKNIIMNAEKRILEKGL